MDSLTWHTDSVLTAQLQKGDKQAFKVLFDRYGPRLYQFSLRYLKEKEEAEDLLNEVFLKIWENRQNLRSDSSFQAYLFTIAYNRIRQFFLKKNREEKYIQAFAEEYSAGSYIDDDRVDYQLFVKRMNEIIGLLPPRRKEIFKLSYQEEQKNAQIAGQLGLSEQFVKKQLSIARKFIIDKIKENGEIAGMLFLYLFTGQRSD
ncbi:MAG: RNA polymerase sigma-70 factor [Prolixibacteraceae bacterium]